jgi:hypothetical protein
VHTQSYSHEADPRGSYARLEAGRRDLGIHRPKTGDGLDIVMAGHIEDVVVDEEVIVEERQITDPYKKKGPKRI